MKTIYRETARICEYEYKYKETNHKSEITAKFSAKFDERNCEKVVE